jgi:hypothetical protein
MAVVVARLAPTPDGEVRARSMSVGRLYGIFCERGAGYVCRRAPPVDTFEGEEGQLSVLRKLSALSCDAHRCGLCAEAQAGCSTPYVGTFRL